MPGLGTFVKTPGGSTVRVPPAEGITEAMRLHVNGYNPRQIAAELTRQGYQKVTTGDTASDWVERGRKIAAKRADELSDATVRRLESITRNLTWLAEIDGKVRAGLIDLDKAMALRIKLDQNLERAASGMNTPLVMPGQVAGGRYAIVDLLDGITDKDVVDSYLDDYRQRASAP